MGVLMLVIPIRAAMAWLSFWGVWTALLRPLAGESAWEFVERAGNFGVPFVLLYLSGFGTSLRSWCFAVARPALDERKARTMEWMLRIIGAACLIGHGAFGAFVMKAEHSHVHPLGARTPRWGVPSLQPRRSG